MKTKIIPATFDNEHRFIIINEDTGEVLDDAQGYGYKTEQSAYKVSWFKFGGGENKINKEKAETKKFFLAHPEIRKFINDFYDYNFKEIMSGLNASDEIIKAVKEQYGIELPKFYVKYF